MQARPRSSIFAKGIDIIKMAFTMFKFLKTLLAILIVAPALVQGVANTTVRLFHDRNCRVPYMDIEVWVDTCATWMEEGWSSHMILRRSSTRTQYIHTFNPNACALAVTTCVDNRDALRCINTGSAAAYPWEVSNAINSWGTKMDYGVCDGQ